MLFLIRINIHIIKIDIGNFYKIIYIYKNIRGYYKDNGINIQRWQTRHGNDKPKDYKNIQK